LDPQNSTQPSNHIGLASWWQVKYIVYRKSVLKNYQNFNNCCPYFIVHISWHL
jgi:hypothetical protein